MRGIEKGYIAKFLSSLTHILWLLFVFAYWIVAEAYFQEEHRTNAIYLSIAGVFPPVISYVWSYKLLNREAYKEAATIIIGIALLTAVTAAVLSKFLV